MPSPKSRRLLDQSGLDWRPERLNRTVLLALEALAEALDDAGLSPDALRRGKVGIALGTTVGCTFHDEHYYISWREGNKPDPDPVHQYLESNLAAFLQAVLGVSGPVAVVTNACASGTDAIGIARGWLDQGICDIAIAGGADALSRIAYYGFASLMLLSNSPCTPFDRDRAGLNLGEGAALLILEHRDKAARRNAAPRGWIRGYGAASDCHHPTAPHPQGRGLQSALQQAMDDAGVDRGAISFINAHGTGTSANDSAEMNAVAALDFTDCPVVSTKGITGHMLGAAGAMEAILTILTLAEQQTRGTVNCTTPDPGLARPPLVGPEPVQLKGRIGISQSLAFGGTNSALVMEA
jgi:3-oxoacyl-[acyl-carrier-protein] synthase-1/3-oxoacyl-[acyl-carrier-protein] synthase II